MRRAYNAQGLNPGLAHDGRPVPTWDKIAPEKREQIHEKWGPATEAIAGQVIDEAARRLRAGCRPDEVIDDLRERFSSSVAPAITQSGDSD